MRYEYMTQYSLAFLAHFWEDDMARLDADGWEVISVVEEQGAVRQLRTFLRRPVREVVAA